MNEQLKSRAVASCSFGKDSLAMCLRLMEEGYPLDEIVFYDTGMEFQAVYAEKERFTPIFEGGGISVTTLTPRKPFLWDMFARPVHARDGSLKPGYGWCGGPCRWGTTAKNAEIARYSKGALIYVGIAADETDRPQEPAKRYPLIEWGMTEADCLQYCYDHGAEWREGDVRLYDILSRVSCWCCRNKNKRELRAIRDYLPEYWERLLCLEMRLGTMKDKPLNELFDEQGRLF